MKSSPENIITVATAQTSNMELAEGWASAHLPQVCDINPPKPPTDAFAPETPVTFVPMPSVDADAGAITAPETRLFSKVRSGFTAFREGDVIFAKITPCMENGKAAIARNLSNGVGFGSTEFHVFRSNGAVLPEFIYHFVRQKSFRQAAEAEMTGSVGQKRVPADFLRQVGLPVAPLAEQGRIVAKIDELFAHANTARARLARIAQILKRFRQAVLSAACSGQLTEDWRQQHAQTDDARILLDRIRKSHEARGLGHGGKAAEPTEDVHTMSEDELPDSWAISELMWLCEPGRPITYGILKPGPDLPDGVPYIRVADFPNDNLNLFGIRRTSIGIAQEYRRSTLRTGDILLSIRGTAGRVCHVPTALNGANITQDTARIAVHHEMSAKYVEMYLRCPSVRKRLGKAMKGVAVRGVNIGDVRALQIAVPPLVEQCEIMRRVDALSAHADAIEKQVRAATMRAEKLPQAILAKAFRGELVPTEAELARREGRDYEPATALLKRIHAEPEPVLKSVAAGKNRHARGARSAQRRASRG